MLSLEEANIQQRRKNSCLPRDPVPEARGADTKDGFDTSLKDMVLEGTDLYKIMEACQRKDIHSIPIDKEIKCNDLWLKAKGPPYLDTLKAPAKH
jgi:hypothetical protein